MTGLPVDTVLVNASDGPAGTVKAWLCNRSGRLTHLVIRNEQPWGGEEIPVPIQKVELVDARHVQLRLDRRALALLPALLAGTPSYAAAGSRRENER